MDSALIQKYNIAAPRYTSYPTVPFWDNGGFSENAWTDSLKSTFKTSNASDGLSLYIHLPYCESLCTFCGCNKRITKNHAVESPYIDAILKEWELYLAIFEGKPRLAEIHLGGGTPSFFAPKILQKLIQGILNSSELANEIEFGFEGHPNNTSYEHLKVLYDLGFRRVSFGVQDYDPIVQKAIHRLQPYKNVENVTQWAREIGYTSVSHDLVFGLPFQKISSIENTIQQTIRLKPDRISFYSYAHVPWLKGNGQRGFRDEDLPSGTEKRALYERGRELFEAAGYVEIGMDHFALKSDSMYKAMENGTLHRNFMGYTTTQTKVLLGLGVSSISDSWGAFAQNVKEIDEYLDLIAKNKLPVFRGHILTEEDLFLRQHILNVICNFKTSWKTTDWDAAELGALLESLESFRDDKLLIFNELGLEVLPAGRPFIRNICMVFDKRLQRSMPKERIFSQSI